MKDFSLNLKFSFVLAIFVTASVVISILGIQKLGTLNESLDRLVDFDAKRVVFAKNIGILVGDLRTQERTMILDNIEGAKKLATDIDEIEKNLRSTMGKFSDLATEVGKKDVVDMLASLDQWHGLHTQVRDLSFVDKDSEATEIAMLKSRPILRGIFEKAEELGARNTKFMEEAAQAASDLYETSRKIIITVSALAILSGLLLAFFIMRSLGRAIDMVIQNLNDSSAQVTSAAQQIASSSEELSQAATEQASSLQETSSAVEEMNSMVQRNTETAKESAQVSGVSGDSALKGKRVVEDMMRSMDEINASNVEIMKQTNESNQKIQEIVHVISEIGNKTKVINDIVFQTKLLSFNASVEAARAGEHGKGFAVVAEEVGNLAQMSGNAAKDITTMLGSSIQKVESIVQETKVGIERLIAQSKSKVEMGTKVAQSCGDVLEEIVRNVSQVTDMSRSISTASDEQSRGINEITKAITQLDQVTQQNAAASEETASAAEELSAQAETMRGVVQTLITTVKGSRGDAPVAQTITTLPTRARTAAPQKPTGQHSNAQVLHFSAKKSGKGRASLQGAGEMLQAAAGSDLVPSEHDPRFKEV